MSSGVVRISLVVCATALLFASVANGASLLTPYNVIVQGDFQSTADVGGGIAVGGELSFSGSYALVDALNGEPISAFGTNSPTLVVAGSVSSGANLQPGAGNYYVPVGTSVTPAPSGCCTNLRTTPGLTTSPVNFASQFSTFDTESQTFSNDATTGTPKSPIVNNTIELDVSQGGLNVFDINYATLESATQIDIKLSNGATFSADGTYGTGNAYVVINVVGGTSAAPISVSLSNWHGTSLNGATCDSNTCWWAQDVLYNFYEVNSLTVSGKMTGSVLAPWAAVTGTAGQMEGSLIAQSFTGQWEFHNFDFMGGTPEPAPFAVVGLGLLGLAYFRKRRRA
jgi:choice-of-anchor A domain-containing protein